VIDLAIFAARAVAGGNSMRPIVTVAFAVLLGFLADGAQAAQSSACPPPPPGLSSPGQLEFGTTNPPPAPGLKPINLVGFEFDFSTALARTMCLKPGYTVLAFAGLFPALEAHKFDIAIAGIGITAQREQTFAFVPYFLGGIRLMVRKDSGLFFQDERELCGHSIAVLSGSVEARDLDKYKGTCPPARPMEVRILPSNNEIVEQLRKGTVQVAFLDWAPVSDIVARNPGDFAVASPILTGEPPGEPRHRDGLMMRKEDTALKQSVTEALARLESDGTYDSLLAKWGLQEGDIRKGG
jgi:polar amino acid transport system substrate-binding protein